MDTVRKPLQPPYEGPYSVIERHDKYFIVQFPNRKISVSIDRLKPAYILNDNMLSNNNNNLPLMSTPSTNVKDHTEICKPMLKEPYVTSSGRVIRKPVRFQ